MLRSLFARAVRITRWVSAGMEEEATGLNALVGWLAAVGMLAGFAALLRGLAPGVADWIDSHSVNNGEIWLVEMILVALVPLMAIVFVVDGLGWVAKTLLSRFTTAAEPSGPPGGALSARVSRGGRLAVGLGLVMLCLVVVGPTLATRHGSAVQVRFVGVSRVVPAHASARYAARCPISHPHPVNGAFGSSPGGEVGTVGLAASYPRGERDWVVVVQNLTTQPQAYVAGVVCLRASAKFAYPREAYVVDPHATSGARVPCPSAVPHSIGAYFNVQSPGDRGKALLDNIGTDRRGDQEFGVAGVKSSTSAPIGMYGGAVCTSLEANFYGFDRTLAPGGHDVQISICPRRTPVPVGGFAFAKAQADDGGILVIATGRIEHRGYAGVRNLTDHAVPYSAGALCVS